MTAKLIIFDLDGTLAETKSEISNEMLDALNEILNTELQISIVSGGAFPQFNKQLLAKATQVFSKEKLHNIFLFPTSGTSFYKFNGNNFSVIYQEFLTVLERNIIVSAFETMIEKFQDILPVKNLLYGEQVEDRLTQVTFSAFGQQAPVEVKKNWDLNSIKRLKMISFLEERLNNQFDIRSGGSSSIDITLKNRDKSYAIFMMENYLNIKKENMVFVGDQLGEYGNDKPVKDCGVFSIATSGPQETIEIIKSILSKER